MPKSPAGKRPKSPPGLNLKNDSAAEIAKALGVSKGRVHQLFRDGMPHTVDAALAWRADRGSTTGPGDALKAERCRLVAAQADRAELELAERRGELIKKTDVTASVAHTTSVMRTRLWAFQNDMPPRLEGLSASEMIPIFRQALTDLFNDLATCEFYDSPASLAVLRLTDDQIEEAVASTKPQSI